ncbi:FAD-dependent oxidoreductase [Candidatus Dojkabacteria bacterium]|nr:FAD-dependent oxidoreductase [Candidatus Dojkabacteria bacterium]
MDEKIIIIGGGIAGLTSAYYLNKAGYNNITVLEKTNRLGGRMYSYQTKYGIAEIGAIIIPKWYKYLMELINDLNIETTDNPYSNVTPYFDLGTGKLEKAMNAKTIFEGIVLLLKNISTLRRSSIYNPIPISQEESYDKFNKQLGNDARITLLMDSIIQGFCYPSIQYFPDEILLPALKKLIFSGGIEKGVFLKRGNESLIGQIRKDLNATIKLKKNITSVDSKKKIVKTKEGDHKYDKLIFATLPDEYLKLNIPETNSVKFHVITTNTNNKLYPEGKEDWGGIIKLNRNPNKGLNIVFINPLEGLGNRNNTVITHYVADYNKETTSPKEIEDFIIQKTRDYIPAFEIDSVLHRHTWEKTIPTLSAKTIQTIKAQQGSDDIYYAGDYLGFPSMEVAVYSGKHVASLISK